LFNSVFYLQIFGDASTLLGLGTILLALASIVALIVTIKQNQKVGYLEFVKDTDLELSNYLKEELNLKGRDACIIYSYNYIDLCDRIILLIEKKKVPREFFEYYVDFFNYAVTVMWWYAKIYPEDQHSLKTSWSSLKNWIIDNNEMIPYPIMHLPSEMKKILIGENIDLDVDQDTIKKDLIKVFSYNEN
jgi:hypothetical protein